MKESNFFAYAYKTKQSYKAKYSYIKGTNRNIRKCGDTLDKIVLLGDTSRFTLDGIPYESGTIITKANITKLKYTPLDTDTNYDVLLQWKAYDNRGLSSE